MDQLTTKVGPLPAIGWAGLAGGAYVAYAYATRNRSAPESSSDIVLEESPPVDAGYGDVGDSDNFTYGYGNATGAYNVNAGTVTVTDPGNQVQSTEDWARLAINHLIGEGVSVSDATTAIWAYLNQSESSLTGSQFNAWQEAVRKFGLPPSSTGLKPPTQTQAGPSTGTAQPGWYYQLPDSTKKGPFTTQQAAIDSAINDATELGYDLERPALRTMAQSLVHQQ